MVELIFLFIALLTTFIITHTLTLKSFREGLSKGYELSNNIKPTEPKSVVETVKEHIDHKEEVVQTESMASTFNEWLNGA